MKRLASLSGATRSVVVIGVLANGVLELLDTLRHAHNFLFERGLFRLEVAELLVKSDTLSSHRSIVSVDLLLDAMQLIGQSLSGVLTFHSKNILKSLLLTAQDLDLLLVCGEVLVQLAASLRQIREFTFKVGCVLRTLHLAHSCLT